MRAQEKQGVEAQALLRSSHYTQKGDLRQLCHVVACDGVGQSNKVSPSVCETGWGYRVRVHLHLRRAWRGQVGLTGRDGSFMGIPSQKERKQNPMRECAVGAGVALAGGIWNIQKSCGRCSWRGSLRPGQHGSKARSSHQSWICTHLFFHSFNKNALHAKPLPGAVPLGAGHTQWEGSFCPLVSCHLREQERHGEVEAAA